MHRADSLAGVSPVYLFVLFLVEALWFVWGIQVWELAITVSAATMGTLCAINVGYWVLRRWRNGGSGRRAPDRMHEKVGSDQLA